MAWTPLDIQDAPEGWQVGDPIPDGYEGSEISAENLNAWLQHAYERAVADAPGGTPDATSETAGKVKLAGDLGGTAAAPTVPGLASKAASSDSRFPTADEKAALAGTAGSPSAENPLVTSADTRLIVSYIYDEDSGIYVPVESPVRNFLGPVDPVELGFDRDGDTWDPTGAGS